MTSCSNIKLLVKYWFFQEAGFFVFMLYNKYILVNVYCGVEDEMINKLRDIDII